ncbi:ADP-ribosylation factor-like protein 9, partial [Psammomys obesus]|uniref:ADP-ribosylation factor-like protein 9 n=1 Tax=Psammomys obesus TaxID=48139 RepID=UPI002452B0AC
SVDSRNRDIGKEKGKEEEKRRSVEMKIKEKGKEEEKRKSVDVKMKENGKDKGKEEKNKNDLKNKENEKETEVKEEETEVKEEEPEKEKEQVTEEVKESSSTEMVKERSSAEPVKGSSSTEMVKESISAEPVKESSTELVKRRSSAEMVKESSSTSIRTLYLPPVRDLGPSPPRPGRYRHPDRPTGLCYVKAEETNKQILVLGLDGAGKTSVLHLLASNRVQPSVAPTQGFNTVCISTEDKQMEFLEIGGSEPFRSYWDSYLPTGWLLIFVVDSADHKRLPEAKKCLHQLMEQNPALPLVVFANKQDLEAAYHITDIHDALALSEVGSDRKLFLFGTQVTGNGSEIPTTMQDAKDLIAHLATNT